MANTNINTADSIEAIKKLIAEFKSLQGQTKNTSKSFTDLQNALASLNGVSSQTNAQFTSLQKQLANSQKSQKNYVTQTRNLKKETALLKAENEKLEASLKKSQLQAKKTGGAFKGILSSVKSITRAFGIVAGIQLFANIIKNAFSLIKTFDSLRFTLERVSKGAYDVANNTAFLDGIVNDFGVNLVSTTERYIKFLAAAKNSGLNMRDTESIFKSMTKASSVLGLKTDELSGVYLALEQMLSKGKVTTEELRRQLGERLPGAMGIMAASMGKTIEELDTMMKKGEVLSAKVLPDFARAVEIAFGIENIDKVDTIVAAQNRMTSSWQNFIKVIGSSSGWLGDVFEWISNRFEDISLAIMDDAQILQKNLSHFMKKSEESLRLEAEWDVEDGMGMIGYYDKLREKILENRKTTELASGDLKKKLEEDGAKLINELLIANKKREEAQRKRAKINIEASEKEFLTQKLFIEKRQELLKKAEEESKKQLNPKDENRVLHNIDVLKNGGLFKDENGVITEFNNNMDNSLVTLAKLKADFLTLRKAVEAPSKVPDIIIEPNGSKKRKTDTSDLDSRIAQLKTLIARLDVLRNSAESNATDSLEYTASILVYETQIIDLEYKKRVRIIEDASKEEFKTKKMTADEMIIAEEKKIQDIIKVTEEGEKKKQKIYEDYFDSEQEQLVNNYKKTLLLEINAINASNKSQKQKQQEIKDLKVSAYNDMINDQIKYLKDQVALWELEGNIKKAVYEEIAELETKLKANAAESSLDVTNESLIKQLDLLKEFSQSIFGLIDAFSDRKIEAIDAEIRAEEKKYDRLIELAENDKSKKEALEKQRDDAVAILEKKRLKEEQRQAKFRKAQALVDIAINTAVAITRLPADGGFLGLLAVPAMIALGALQAAAVLASPIPQYADGLDNAKQDHVAMINDGGKKEYVERNGKILSTDTRNAIVSLKKGDTVHKDYDSMVKNSMLYSILSNGNQFSQLEFENLSNVIETSISKGFSNARINNKVNLTNKLPNTYLLKKSRFNG